MVLDYETGRGWSDCVLNTIFLLNRIKMEANKSLRTLGCTVLLLLKYFCFLFSSSVLLLLDAIENFHYHSYHYNCK